MIRVPSPSPALVSSMMSTVKTNGFPYRSKAASPLSRLTCGPSRKISTLVVRIESAVRLCQGREAVPWGGGQLVVVQRPHHEIESQARLVQVLDDEDVLRRCEVVGSEVLLCCDDRLIPSSRVPERVEKLIRARDAGAAIVPATVEKG